MFACCVIYCFIEIFVSDNYLKVERINKITKKPIEMGQSKNYNLSNMNVKQVQNVGRFRRIFAQVWKWNVFNDKWPMILYFFVFCMFSLRAFVSLKDYFWRFFSDEKIRYGFEWRSVDTASLWRSEPFWFFHSFSVLRTEFCAVHKL